MSLPRPSTGTIVKLAVVLVALAVLAWFALRGIDLRAAAETAINWLREAGPWVFFTAMAILPAFGAPISVFTLVAGPAFGLAISIPAAAAAMLVNMTINYWIARRWLRPAVEWFFRRTSYKIPRSKAENHRMLTVLVRLTPGLPYFAQGYVLGLAEVRFWVYLPISFAIQYLFALGFLIFGEALMKGRVGMIVAAVTLLVVATLAFQLLRRRYARGNPTPT
ncbi:MAG TPA: VTT domain-containing protein [Opitutaceae bacterium]|nr:VTT domain-containing protein [Opitutaceae bacterium]